MKAVQSHLLRHLTVGGKSEIEREALGSGIVAGGHAESGTGFMARGHVRKDGVSGEAFLSGASAPMSEARIQLGEQPQVALIEIEPIDVDRKM